MNAVQSTFTPQIITSIVASLQSPLDSAGRRDIDAIALPFGPQDNREDMPLPWMGLASRFGVL